MSRRSRGGGSSSQRARSGCAVKGTYADSTGKHIPRSKIYITPAKACGWNGRVYDKKTLTVRPIAPNGDFEVVLVPSTQAGLYQVVMGKYTTWIDVPDRLQAHFSQIEVNRDGTS